MRKILLGLALTFSFCAGNALAHQQGEAMFAWLGLMIVMLAFT